MKRLPYYHNPDLEKLFSEHKEIINQGGRFREGYTRNAQGMKNTPKQRHSEIPIWERSSLTIDEAAEYSGVGRTRLRLLTDREDCPFVLWVGSKRLIRRKKLDEYLDKVFSI